MSVKKIIPLEEAYRLVDDLKRQGKCVVFTNGCFDLIHPGHTRLLAEARKLGDVLVVAVNSDASVRGLHKGPDRPILPQDERAEILAALGAVDYVTLFDQVSVLPVVERMLPSVLVKGATWGPNEIVGREVVEAAGGKVVSLPVVEGFSTTSIVQAATRLFSRNS
jgi:D-beta-D-heptose 7-phosphate kinase/D-beta-D-heptose 1-phosphate adenosyltransferase